jgi:hypothetical protein
MNLMAPDGALCEDRHLLLFYATQILSGNPDENLELRIPPEVRETVNQIIDSVQERQRVLFAPSEQN